MRTQLVYPRIGQRDGHFDLRAVSRHGERNAVIVSSVDFTYGTTRERVYEGDSNNTVYRGVGNDAERRSYIRAEDTVRNIEIYAGSGVYVRTNMAREQSVFVYASLEMSPADEELFMRFAELDTVIRMHQVNLNRPSVTVDLTSFGTNSFFVYNAEGRLLGTTADPRLPWSDVYYLTTAQINLGLGGASQGAEEAPAPEVPVTGGAPSAPAVNQNFNPGTGR
jgi:hypothetical protein